MLDPSLLSLIPCKKFFLGGGGFFPPGFGGFGGWGGVVWFGLVRGKKSFFYFFLFMYCTIQYNIQRGKAKLIRFNYSKIDWTKPGGEGVGVLGKGKG